MQNKSITGDCQQESGWFLFKQTLGHTLAFTQTGRVRQDKSITEKQITGGGMQTQRV